MGELPTGTVSMLFSDIEGSTLLLNRLGPDYLETLDGHRRIMRDAWLANGGTEMGTEGDSFFVVFPTAEAAVRAAAQAQRGLAAHAWPRGGTVRVRIGIHTGSPQVHDGDYWGMDVHRAARIAAAAHGGQVVLSAVTADLARAGLPDGAGFRDLGQHRLKDIPAPEHLYQLTVPGLEHDFPALRTVGTSTSLPHPATPLLGRESDIADLTALLSAPDVRLVTLEGVGGSGKTRLAVAVADAMVPQFVDGVYFVPLATVTTAELMWSSIAETLDVPPSQRAPGRLLAAIEGRSALLVLDNLEQVTGADEVVDRLLRTAPRIVVVATSRQPIGLPAEHRHPVSPLALPDEPTVDGASGSAAVQLFVERAASVRPGFRLTDENVEAVTSICRRLDGLPLAIELCASRIRLLAPRALLARLDQALDIASTSRLTPSRQRTLRSAIAWSHDLLSPEQQALFRRVSVFTGGGDLTAVEAVTAGVAPDRADDPLDTVGALVDANLADVLEGPDGEPRVTMLQTIRAFGQEQLRDAGEEEAARTAHAIHFAEVAERLQQRRQTRHMDALGAAETELDNFRDALAWSVPADGDDGRVADRVTALRLCAALGWVWWMGGYVAEGRQWYERVIAAAGGGRSPELAACIGGLANLLLSQGEFARAYDLARDSLVMARSLDDLAAEAFALGVLGTAQLQLGEVEAARSTLEQAADAQHRRGDRGMLARALGNLGGIEETLGNLERAETLINESLGILDELGDVHESAIQRQNLANLLVVAGRAAEARDLAEGLVEPVLRLRNPNLTMAFANTWMNILLRLDQPARAAQLFGAEEAMHERLDVPNPYHDEELAEALDLVAGVMTAQEWDAHRQVGRGMRVEDLLVQLAPGQPR